MRVQKTVVFKTEWKGKKGMPENIGNENKWKWKGKNGIGKEDKKMKYGYARISTGKQKTDRQIDILEKYNLDRIYADVVTGSKFDRPEYQKLTEEILREGDELFVKEVDRLGRNKSLES